MRTWGEFLRQVRVAVLRDSVPDEETGEFRFSDEELLVVMGWALDTFAAHTALATSIAYTPATATFYELPAAIYDGDNIAQTISVKLYSGGQYNYLDPVRYTEGFSPMKESAGYTVFPDRQLNIPAGGDDTSILTLQYFSYYPHPTVPESVILTPRWAEVALSYLVGSRSLVGAGLKAAIIGQWKAKPDTGNPEHNPVSKQQKFFMCLYEDELRKRQPQDRLNAFRATHDQY